MEWTDMLPPPKPGTMFTDGYDVDDANLQGTAAQVVEHTAAVAKELATGKTPALKRRRSEKKQDVTSRQLPPVYDWTAVAEPVEPAQPVEPAAHRPTVVAAPAPAVVHDEHADLWGVGTEAAASPAPVAALPTDHIRPAVAPRVDDWGLPDEPVAVPEPAPFEMLVAFEAPEVLPPIVVAEPVVVPVAVDPEPDQDESPTEEVVASVPAPSTNAAAGLAKRVRGAQMPDTGPAMGAVADPNRSAADVRSSLARFQTGVRKGQEDAGHSTDD
jgi:hypothetical protein